MRIIGMTSEALPALAKLECLCFSRPWNEAMLGEELENPYAHFLVAWQESQIVGYVGCHMIEGEGYIANVAVHPDWRRQGIGQALIEKLQDDAKKNHLAFLTLEVRASNQSAQALYLTCGFQKVGIRKNFYSHPTENAWIMTNNLKGKS